MTVEIALVRGKPCDIGMVNPAIVRVWKNAHSAHEEAAARRKSHAQEVCDLDAQYARFRDPRLKQRLIRAQRIARQNKAVTAATHSRLESAELAILQEIAQTEAAPPSPPSISEAVALAFVEMARLRLPRRQFDELMLDAVLVHRRSTEKR